MIVSYSPFISVEDNKEFRFKCPICGFDSCTRFSGSSSINFYTGYFRCSRCGSFKDSDNVFFSHFHSCFYDVLQVPELVQVSESVQVPESVHVPKSVIKHVQLTFDF